MAGMPSRGVIHGQMCSVMHPRPAPVVVAETSRYCFFLEIVDLGRQLTELFNSDDNFRGFRTATKFGLHEVTERLEALQFLAQCIELNGFFQIRVGAEN